VKPYSLRTWTAWALAALLAVSTAGIPVHALYCLCKGEWSYALFSADDLPSCGTVSEDSCCKPQGCCSTKAGSCPSGADEEHPCDTGETRVAKLQTDFIGSFDKDQGSGAQANAIACHPAAIALFPSASRHRPTRFIPDDGPPLAAARHVLYRNFRC
jgi:hypothetical protein